ncbi:MAG: hypothetical protein J4F31_08855 [Flavobacteriales bacterium]|nr:hypothetical protein [Flavobacteriales bacterium]
MRHIAGTLILTALVIGWIVYAKQWSWGMSPIMAGIALLMGLGISGALLLIPSMRKFKFVSVALMVNVLIFTSMFTGVYVAQWKPTATIRIDEDFEGTVYLIPAVEAATQFAPDENVIIYWNTERESDVRVLHRSKDISNVLNEAGSSTLNWYRSDSTLWRSLHISCLEIVPGRQCPQAPWNNRHPQCLDREDYDTWVMEGIIDVEKVEFFELN